MNEFSRYAPLAARLPSVSPLLRLDTLSAAETAHLPAGCAVLTGSAAVLDCCAGAGMEPKRLFFSVTDATEEALQAVHGRCRYLLERTADIQRLDTLVGPLLTGRRLEEVAIRLVPAGAGVFTAADIPAFARLLRRSDNLAVRGVFLAPDGIGDLSQQAKAAFSTAKRLRADLPCVLHAFCLEGLLEPLARGDEALTRTLEMLAALNDTSLYARFYIA